MLPTILQHSAGLIAFITLLNPALYQPQIRHLTNLVDAILVCNGKKTLSNLYHQIAGEPDPKTSADFFRESPWEREDVGASRKQAMLLQFLAYAEKLGLTQIAVSVDDSTGKKDKATRHLEAVCFHHDHNDSSKKKPKFVNRIPTEYPLQKFLEWYDFFTGAAAGDPATRHKFIPVPGDGSGPPGIYEFNQADLDVTEADKWMMQVACWAYGNSPSEFGLTPSMGLGGKGFSEGMENVQYRSMIGPITQYLEKLFTMIIQRWLKQPGLRFRFIGLDPQEDRLKQAQVDATYIGAGVYNVGFVQDRLGVPPEFRPEPGAANPYGLSPTVAPATLPGGNLNGLVPTVDPVTLPGGKPSGGASYGLKPAVAPVPAPVQKAATEDILDLLRWQDKAAKALYAGKSPDVAFTSQAIHADLQDQVRASLQKVSSANELRKVFAAALLEGAAGNFFRQDGADWESYG